MLRRVQIARVNPQESPGILLDALVRAGLHCDLVDMAAAPPRRFDCDSSAGLVVLGGAMNADQTDEYPCLRTIVDWLEQATSAQLPVLGICLGAQLLAQSLGSRVYANPVREIGWYDMRLTDPSQSDRLFSGVSSPQRVFQWHNDTFDLPAGSELLATGDTCTNQVFRYGSHAYGLQCHLEVTPAIIADWLSEETGCCGASEHAAAEHGPGEPLLVRSGSELNSEPSLDAHSILQQTAAELPAMHVLSETVFGRFAECCVARCKVR